MPNDQKLVTKHSEYNRALGNKRAAQPLKAIRALPVLEDEKLKGSDKQSVKRKIASKRPQD